MGTVWRCACRAWVRDRDVALGKLTHQRGPMASLSHIAVLAQRTNRFRGEDLLVNSSLVTWKKVALWEADGIYPIYPPLTRQRLPIRHRYWVATRKERALRIFSSVKYH